MENKELNNNEDKSKARKVWTIYRKVASKGYKKVLEEKLQELGINFTFNEWLDDELEIDSISYKRKWSKFCMDIWGQLISNH